MRSANCTEVKKMIILRKYIAIYEDDEGCEGFPFFSEHRAGSKANLADAQVEAVRLYGPERAQQLTICEIGILDSKADKKDWKTL